MRKCLIVVAVVTACIICVTVSASAAYTSITYDNIVYVTSDGYDIITGLSISCTVKEIYLPSSAQFVNFAGFAYTWSFPRTLLVAGIYYTIDFAEPLSLSWRSGTALDVGTMLLTQQINKESITVLPGYSIHYDGDTVYYTVYYDLRTVSGGGTPTPSKWYNDMPPVYSAMCNGWTSRITPVSIYVSLTAASAGDIIGKAADDIVSGVDSALAAQINPPMPDDVASRYDGAATKIEQAASARQDVADGIQSGAAAMASGVARAGEIIGAGVRRVYTALTNFDSTFGAGIVDILSDPTILMLLSVGVVAIVVIGIMRKMGD